MKRNLENEKYKMRKSQEAQRNNINIFFVFRNSFVDFVAEWGIIWNLLVLTK
jgi:hypothetical protein